MTTTLDTKLVPRAKALLDRYGMTVSVKARGGTANYKTGEVESPGDSTYTGVKITPPFPYEHREIDGDTIRLGDAKSYLAAQDLSFTPIIGMMLTIGSEMWAIVGVGVVRTGDSVALYQLQLRR
jgi:hypothetical protein